MTNTEPVKKQIVYFFFPLRRNATISCFKSKSKSKSKRMDVGDEVLIFWTFGDNSYNLLHSFKTYNLIYSHKYTKKYPQRSARQKKSKRFPFVLMQMINVLNTQCIQHCSIVQCTDTNKWAHYVCIVWKKRHAKNVFHKFCMFLKLSPRKNSIICWL